MKKIKIAIDIDGTLLDDYCFKNNGELWSLAPNKDIFDLVHILSKFKNVDLYLWSNRPISKIKYVRQLLDLPIKESHCINKNSDFYDEDIDIAIDDQHDFDQATFNLIVRNK